MAYKDKDKQREAGKERARRYRNKHKGVTNEGVTDKALPPDLDIREGFDEAKMQGSTKRGKDIECFEDLPPDVQQTIDKMSVVDGKIDQTIKAKRTAIAVDYQHLFPGRYYSTGAVCGRVVTGKPGDADYNGVCTPAWRAERSKVIHKGSAMPFTETEYALNGQA